MSIYDEDRGTYLDHRVDPFDDSEYRYQKIIISINVVFDSKSKNNSIEIEKIYKVFIEKFNKYLESLPQKLNKSKQQLNHLILILIIILQLHYKKIV